MALTTLLEGREGITPSHVEFLQTVHPVDNSATLEDLGDAIIAMVTDGLELSDHDEEFMVNVRRYGFKEGYPYLELNIGPPEDETLRGRLEAYNAFFTTHGPGAYWFTVPEFTIPIDLHGAHDQVILDQGGIGRFTQYDAVMQVAPRMPHIPFDNRRITQDWVSRERFLPPQEVGALCYFHGLANPSVHPDAVVHWMSAPDLAIAFLKPLYENGALREDPSDANVRKLLQGPLLEQEHLAPPMESPGAGTYRPESR